MIESLTKAFRFFVPDYNTRFLNSIEPLIDDINELEPELEKLSDEQLKAKTDEFRARIADRVGEEEGDKEAVLRAEQAALDDILPEAFAVVREAGKRVLGMRHFDVQLKGGIVLHRGMIAEMKTGEGKTLVATLPMYLNALTGRGAHLVTVNDYLARRDAEWMGRLYGFLGLSTGVIVHDLDSEQRRRAYGSDITYGTNNEFGFDYLRDNMAIYPEELCQRHLNFCIVDEVDSILIDEARTPLIISGPADTASEDYQKFAKIVKRLKRDRDYTVEEKAHQVIATEEGIAEVERLASEIYGVQIDNLYDPEHMKKVHYLSAALKAKELYERDKHYVVTQDREVVIVDDFTGRLMPGRRWSDGIHQSVEAKEGVPIVRENQTLGSITFQNLFRMYNKLAGMTGTAKTEAKEFGEIYSLDVIEVPTNRPIQRQDLPDVILKTEREKFEAITEVIQELNTRGQPVLVGTVAIETSERCARELKKAKIPHQVLNAKFHQSEAGIVAQAGRKGAVTIATNMAGRGTDIQLGGNPDAMALEEVGEAPVTVEVLTQMEEAHRNLQAHLENIGKRGDPEAEHLAAEGKQLEEKLEALRADRAAWEEKFEETAARFREQCEKEKQEVLDLGGLYILGTERHDSRRIDNQLRGRSGRQGDPGASQFFISMEDKLMRIFGGPQIKGMIEKLGWEEGEALEHEWIDKAVERSQARVETHHFDIRKNVLKYDNVMNEQRTFIYKERRAALEEEDLAKHILVIFEDVVDSLLDSFINPNQLEDEWNFDGLAEAVRDIYTLEFDPEELGNFERSELAEVLKEKVHDLYIAKEAENRSRLGDEVGGQFQRHVEKVYLLQVIDQHWKDHLYAMDGLQEGIGLQGYAGKDPLVEYKIQATQMFNEMLDRIRMDLTRILFRVEAQSPERQRQYEEQLAREHEERELFYGGGDAESDEPDLKKKKPATRKKAKVGRNDPCPCGSGKKYKKCCGR